jgi:anaerobic selenocysteine-containing dehydrogenase
LRIHPDDAAGRGIAEGDTVKVFNQRGTLSLAAELTDEMQPDVVVMFHGWWGSRIGGSSANALTPDTLADLGGGSMLHDTWVQVKKSG